MDRHDESNSFCRSCSKVKAPNRTGTRLGGWTWQPRTLGLTDSPTTSKSCYGLSYSLGDPDAAFFTDYMPHRIIGPVVVQIHKSDILEPGTYAVTPKVTHWEAPGHIATDKQILGEYELGYESNPSLYHIILNYPAGNKPSSNFPNTNWPFPGHVVINEHTGPV